MPKKQFKLRPDEFRPLAPGRGGCYATDHITVDGHRVGYMYREQRRGVLIAAGGSSRAWNPTNMPANPRTSRSTTSTPSPTMTRKSSRSSTHLQARPSREMGKRASSSRMRSSPRTTDSYITVLALRRREIIS